MFSCFFLLIFATVTRISSSPPLKAYKTSSSSNSGKAASTRVVALIVSHLLQLQQDPDTAAALDRLAAGDSTVLSCCQPQEEDDAATTTTAGSAPLDTTTHDDTAVYWILWATHVLEDLGSAAEFVVSSSLLSSADKDDIAAAVVWFAWSLAPLVRTNSVTTVRILAHAPGHHVLGRVALAAAAAAARALTQPLATRSSRARRGTTAARRMAPTPNVPRTRKC